MCILCELQQLGASPEVILKCKQLVMSLDAVLSICEDKGRIYNRKERQTLDEAQSLLTPAAGVASVEEALKSILGDGVDVNVRVVQMREGESVADTLTRAQTELAAEESAGKTKH